MHGLAPITPGFHLSRDQRLPLGRGIGTHVGSTLALQLVRAHGDDADACSHRAVVRVAARCEQILEGARADALAVHEQLAQCKAVVARCDVHVARTSPG